MIRRYMLTRDGFTPPEFDFEEIRNATLTDSYVYQALNKYSQMIFKAGYRLKSENEEASKYINTRLRTMSYVTKKPMDMLFQEISDDIIKYSNAFLVKSMIRENEAIDATGFYKEGKIVGGYFRVCPSTIAVKTDEFGKIKAYAQIVNGDEKIFKADDVVHFYIDKDANNLFGTPRVLSVLEDVKLLRKIEANIAVMIYRFTIPIFHWIVGSEKIGEGGTKTDIEELRRAIAESDLDGNIITNERVKVNTAGAEGNALNAKDYLDYFKGRVHTGLGVTAAQMGETNATTDSSADMMEAQAHNTVKYIQKCFAIFIENFVINELLLEGGFDPVCNEDDMVKFIFNEISLDTKVKIENHEMLKYSSGVYEFEELRRSLGLREDVDESRLFFKIKNEEQIKIMKEESKEKIRVAKELNKLNPVKPADSGNNSSSNKNSKDNKDVVTRNMPENQYGKTSVKIKESYGSDMHKSLYDDIYYEINGIFTHINKYISNINNIDEYDGNTSIDSIVHNHVENAKFMLMKKMIDIAEVSKESFRDKHNTEKSSEINIDLSPVFELLDTDMRNIENRVLNMISSKEETKDISHNIRMTIEYLLSKTYYYTFAMTAKKYGLKELKIKSSEGSKCEGKENIDLTADINLNDLPPFQPFCRCKTEV